MFSEENLAFTGVTHFQASSNSENLTSFWGYGQDIKDFFFLMNGSGDNGYWHLASLS